MTGSDGGDLSPTSLQITVDLLGENDTAIDQQILPAAAPLGDASSLKSTSSVAVQNAEALVVNVAYPGYTSFSRRLAVEDVVYLNAELQVVEEVTVGMTQTASISGTMIDGFTVALPAGGGEGDIQIGIPRSLLPNGTTSVTADIKSFDPNDPVDAQNFPGDYADTDGNNLVSVAFNYADIRTTDGQSLTTLAKARAELRTGDTNLFATEATDPVIINRSIPASSCATLDRLGDANAEQAGFQIPVYSYDTSRGLWELLGYGSVYFSSGTLIDTVDVSECESDPYVLEIAVTSDIFLSNWWNLDYPLIFSQPVKYCAKVKLQNENAEALRGLYGFYYAEAGEFASNYFITDDAGQAFLEVNAADVGDTLQADIAIFGETNYYSSATLSKDCTAPELQILEASLPRLCQIHGKLEYTDGNPATRHPVVAVPVNYALGDYLGFSASDATGEYWLSASCEKDYTLSVYSVDAEATLLINVDGTAGADEQSDNGNIAEIAPITVTPIPTNVYGSAYSTVDDAFLLLFLGHRDNFPLSYNLTVENDSGQQLGTISGTAQLAAEFEDDQEYLWYFGFGQDQAALNLNVAEGTTLRLRGTLTDSRNKSTAVDTVAVVVNEPLSSVTE